MADGSHRRSLSRERVVTAAVDLADAEGIGAVSMRRVGEALGVEAMSLYNHVANKNDLLAAMADAVALEVDVDPSGSSWAEAARQRCSATFAALVRHSWAPALWATSGGGIGPGRMAFMDGLLGDLGRAGFEPGQLDLAFHILQQHVVGSALQAASFPYADEDLPALGREYLRTFPVERFPRLADHIRYHVESDAGSEESSFAVALDLILDGLERTREPG